MARREISAPRGMMAAVAESMKERTGRTIEEWVELVRASGIDPLDQNAVRKWLKAEHGVPQNSRWAIADAADSREEYIDEQYAGPKAALRPMFERLRAIIEAFGDDVETEGRATYIPFVRRRQFAAVAAATRTRVDVGLRFQDPPASNLLTPANAPGQATHRLSLSFPDEITDEVEQILRAAYEQNG